MRLHDMRWSLSGLLLVLAGCGNPVAEFRSSSAVTSLIPDASKAVVKTLDESFGTPNALVAWERMPVEYHAARGVVATGDHGLQLTWSRPFGHVPQVPEVAPLTWVAGERSGQKIGTAVAIEDVSEAAAVTGVEVSDGAIAAVGFGERLQFGRHVYMKNCQHCHGTTGDGMGPTAQYLNPRPRDYRMGIFKFTSTHSSERATRDDLKRVVLYGIPGTYMPSFLLIGEREAEAVVEYVRFLAMRGEMEKRLTEELADFSELGIIESAAKAKASYEASREGGEKVDRPKSEVEMKQAAKVEFAEYFQSDYATVVDETADVIAGAWLRAEEAESLIFPKETRVRDSAESRERGRKLYLSDRTKCYTCHGETARGDGYATEDFWKKPGSSESYEKRGLHDTWGNPLKPRDLTRGQYRGGRRPLDLYRRMYAGIKGTPMPAFGGTVLNDQELWDIVNYVMSVPFDAPRPQTAAPQQMAATGEHAD